MVERSSVFSLLNERVQKALAELGFSKPTLPQIKAIPPVLKGENILLIAPTGSGKTEAILLPVFHMFMQQQDKVGISILYITPLRALNRDMVERLAFWGKILDMSVEVRHGDTEIKIRRRQALRPPLGRGPCLYQRHTGWIDPYWLRPWRQWHRHAPWHTGTILLDV